MTDLLWRFACNSAENGWMPDTAVRWGIRRLCQVRLREEALRHDPDRFVAEMQKSPVAPVPEKANEQHYEIPPEFFEKVLGPHLKYSCCYWDKDTNTLADAERLALEITCLHAGVEDGQDILELGCGWGSLSLWMAERYPSSSITAVSNSVSQRQFIERQVRQRGMRNLRVITRDMNEFDTELRFDRILSVEMFEHMRNYQELLRRASTWMKPGGMMLIHIFCHQRYAYAFETGGATQWMSHHFFSGGIMPSLDLLSQFQKHARIVRSWTWDGTHYRKTARSWLRNLDAGRQLLALFGDVYGPKEAKRWLRRWRIFFMACEELWGFREGQEWIVAHYLLVPQPAAAPTERDTATESELAPAA